MTSVVIRQPFTCASCGGTFLDRHSCPTVLSQTLDPIWNGPVVTVAGNLVTRPA